MPKTTFQRVVYTILGVLFSATAFAVFNKYLVYENSTYIQVWSLAFWKEVLIAFCQKAPLAFILQFFFVQKIVGKWSSKYPTDNVYLKRMIRVPCTITIMAPIMCLYSNLICLFQLHWTVGYMFGNIVVKLCQNTVFGFFSQVMVVQPLVSLIFNLIFGKKNKKEESSVKTEH